MYRLLGNIFISMAQLTKPVIIALLLAATLILGSADVCPPNPGDRVQTGIITFSYSATRINCQSVTSIFSLDSSSQFAACTPFISQRPSFSRTISEMITSLKSKCRAPPPYPSLSSSAAASCGLACRWLTSSKVGLTSMWVCISSVHLLSFRHYVFD